MIGTALGHFRILARLASSEAGEVYRAEDEALLRHVALEVLSPALASDPDRKERFLRTARAAAAVTHPHLAAIHEVGETGGRVWVAMELVEGPTLRRRLTGRPLPPIEMLKIGEQVAEGLAAAHGKGLAHGDLKPERVVLCPGGQVKVVGLGIGAGDPGQEGRPADLRADVRRLGAILHEMATGRAPTEDEVLTVPAGLDAESSAGLGRIMAACLESDTGEGYQSASQVAVDLGTLRRRMDMVPESVPGGTWLRTIRPRARFAGASALAVLLAIAAWTWLRPLLDPGPPFTGGDRLIVADFVNETGDLELGVALRDVFERFFPDDVTLATVQRDTSIETAALDAQGAAARCRQGECKGYVTGRLSGDANEYRLDIAVHRSGRSRPVVARSTRAASSTIGLALFATIEDLARALDEASGVGRRHEPYCRAWSGDANGIKALHARVRAIIKGKENPAELLVLYRKARDLDPGNPQYYWNIGYVLSELLGRRGESIPYIKEAWQRASVALEEHPECRYEALRWEIMYLERTWRYDTMAERVGRGVQLFPEQAEFWFMYGVISERMMGDPAAAIPYLRKAADLNPNFFHFLAEYLLSAGDLTGFDALLEGYRHHPDTLVGGEREAQIARFQLSAALVRGDDYGAIVTMVERLVAEGRLPERAAPDERARYLALAGRLSDAERWAREATRERARAAMRSGVVLARGYDLLDWLERRRTGKVRPLAADDLDAYLTHANVLTALAQVSVDLGAAGALREVLQAVETEQKDNHDQHVVDVIQFSRGCLASIEGRSAEALRLLEPLGRGYTERSGLAPHHVLGRACEAAGRWADAAKAYEAVLERRHYWTYPEVGSFGPVRVLDQHRLAGIYERLGNTERARYWYGRFLHDWRDADPGTPEVEDAKRRLAALGGPLPAVAS